VLETPDLTERVTAVEGDFVFQCRAIRLPFAFHGDFHFGNVLFASLLFASLPHLSVRRRTVLLALGLPLLFLLNLTQLFFNLQTFYAMPGNVGPVIANSYAYPRGAFRWIGLPPRDFYNYGSAVLSLGARFFPLILWVFVHFAFRERPGAPLPPGPPPSPRSG
jgi:hypothetical protein